MKHDGGTYEGYIRLPPVNYPYVLIILPRALQGNYQNKTKIRNPTAHINIEIIRIVYVINSTKGNWVTIDILVFSMDYKFCNEREWTSIASQSTHNRMLISRGSIERGRFRAMGSF